MKCPACHGSDLEPKQLEQGLVAASCTQCEGALLSLINYRFWAEHAGQDVSDDGSEESATPEVVEEKALVCPKCARLMTKFKIGLMTDRQLDLCSHCDEAWLDHGEWRILKQLELHGQLPKIFTESWQRGIRKERMYNLVKQRYIDMIGEDDFERVETFKQWLDQHESKEDIKQFLVTSYD